MVQTNCCVNSIQGNLTITQNISGYCLPVSKYYTNTLSPSSYNLTTTTSEISGMNVQLIDQGIYEIKVNIVEDLSALTASAAANYSLYQLYQGTSVWSSISNTERTGTNISIMVSEIAGINSENKSFSWIVNNDTANNIIKLYGKINSSITGMWKVISDTTGRSTIFARLIA
jgi:hypothetical protein